MGRNILITGGAGFIGSHLALKLVELGYRVTVLDSLSSQIHGPGPSPLYLAVRDKVRFIKGDVRSQAAWDEALPGQEVVVHLAAETGTGQSMYEVARYVDVNVQGTAMLLDHLVNRKHAIAKVVVASSRAVYGEGKYRCGQHGSVYPIPRREEDLRRGHFDCTCPRCAQPVLPESTDEESAIHPASVYGITKYTQERLVLAVTQSLGIAGIAFRYQNVYGPGQSLNNPYTGILSIFSTQVRNGHGINVFEDGQESRDFVYIDDVVDATILGIDNSHVRNDVLNVGSGQPVTVSTVADKLIAAYNADVKATVTGQYRAGDIRHNFASIAKVNAVIGFTPRYDFEAGIARFVEWVKSQTVAEDKYLASVAEMKRRGLFGER